MIVRELNKLYSGFSIAKSTCLIASSHWGCGAFGGDKALKFILQQVVASQTRRDLIFFASANELNESPYNNILATHWENSSLTVGDIVKGLEVYNEYFERGSSDEDVSSFLLKYYIPNCSIAYTIK